MTANQQRRWNAELEIIKKLGRIPSSREMQKLLEQDYGIHSNHNIINDDLKKDLETLTDDEFLNKKETLLKKLEDEFDIAHTISKTSKDEKTRLDAMTKTSKLAETISKIAAIFKKAQIELKKEQRPIYNIHIGQPKKADIDDKTKLEKKHVEEKNN